MLSVDVARTNRGSTSNQYGNTVLLANDVWVLYNVPEILYYGLITCGC